MELRSRCKSSSHSDEDGETIVIVLPCHDDDGDPLTATITDRPVRGTITEPRRNRYGELYVEYQSTAEGQDLFQVVVVDDRGAESVATGHTLNLIRDRHPPETNIFQGRFRHEPTHTDSFGGRRALPRVPAELAPRDRSAARAAPPQVFATDSDGNVDPTPAEWTWVKAAPWVAPVVLPPVIEYAGDTSPPGVTAAARWARPARLVLDVQCTEACRGSVVVSRRGRASVS